MHYNIAKNSIVSANTTLGNVSITSSGINALLNYSELPVATLKKSSNHILVLDCDLGSRIDTYSVNYNFRCNTPIASTASGIKFYYRDESFGNYILLNTSFSGTESFYSTVSGSLFAPRYIRVITTMTSISGTTVTGTLHGFSVLNNDTIVDFGTDGTKTEENFYLLREGVSETRTVPIYNSGVYTSDAIVNVEPSLNDLDKVISIADNTNGPWVYVFDDNLLIADIETFDNGSYNNSTNDDGVLRTTGIKDKDLMYVSKNIYGTYTTKVLECSDSEQSVFKLNKMFYSLGGKIAVDAADSAETIEVRSCNTPPGYYSIYRLLYTYYPGSGPTSYLTFRDYWTITGTLKQTSVFYFYSFSNTAQVPKNYHIVIDPETERWAGFVYTEFLPGGASKWFIFNNMKESSTLNKTMVTTPINTSAVFKWNDIMLDSLGGVWVSFQATAYDSEPTIPDFVDNTGHYLAYFDNTLTERFKFYTYSKFIHDMAVDYNEGFVWYTHETANSIMKLSREGEVVVNYGKLDYTDALGGITVLSDESVWYFNGGSLHRVKVTGPLSVEFLDTIENVSELEFSRLEKDGDGSLALWFIEELSVGRIFVSGSEKGQVDFKITVDSPSRLIPVENGCWAICGSERYAVFISRTNRRIERNVQSTYASTLGILEQIYTNKNYTGHMPISTDTVWQNVAWNKININTYMLSEDKYQQLRITFRNQTPSERYPELPAETQFIQNDYFTQANGAPVNTQLWGNWTKTLNTVNVVTNRLMLPSSTDPNASNPFIDTKNRMLIGSDSSNVWDIRINFMFNTGVATGKFEKLYLYVIAYDADGYGDYMYTTYDPGFNTTAYLYVFTNTVSANTSATYNTTMGWQGTLRLYKDSSNNISAQYDRLYDGVFEKTVSLPLANNYGTYFYISMSSLKAGSNTYIDSFQVVSGNVYYYTETPGVNSIYTIKPVVIEDIAPNTFKNLYVKSQIPSGLSMSNQYETNLNVKWRIPII